MRRLSIGGAAVVLMVAAQAPGLASTGSATCTTAGAQAAADGVRTAFHGNNVLPLTNDAESDGPSTAALVGPSVSSGEAGAPYPGPAVLTAISLGGGVVASNGGPGFDSSTYPFTVQSQYPTAQQASASFPGLTLQSQSDAGRTSATATGGNTQAPADNSSAGATSATSTANCATDGNPSADAATDSEALSFGAGVLRIGRVHSEAHAFIGPDGHPHTSSKLDVGQFTVAGQTVELTDGAFSGASQSVPLPQQPASLLTAAGISLLYVTSQSDPSGRAVTAPGLAVSITQPLNQAGVGTGPSTVTYTFGRASAAVTGAASATAPAAGSVPAATPGGTTAATPSGPAPTGTQGSATPPVPVASGPATGTVRSAAGPVQRTADLAGLRVPDMDWRLLYLLIVVGLTVLAGGWLLLRQIGERLKWM